MTDGVEIALQARLDGITSEYCLDIAGGNRNVDPAKGLQAHTCYSYQGQLGSDQVFDPQKLKDDGLLFMPAYEVCVTLSELAAGAQIELTGIKASFCRSLPLQ
ncbi:MAG: hypothetical protein AAFQ82_22260, partial [Myxococcota bacterium]